MYIETWLLIYNPFPRLGFWGIKHTMQHFKLDIKTDKQPLPVLMLAVSAANFFVSTSKRKNSETTTTTPKKNTGTFL